MDRNKRRSKKNKKVRNKGFPYRKSSGKEKNPSESLKQQNNTKGERR